MIQYGQYTVPTYKKMVNFGVGQPSTELLPLDIIKYGMKEVLDIEDPSLLQYGDIPGYLEFRRSLANFLEKEYSKKVEADDLFITNGVTQALTLLCSLFTSKNDVILVEEPTYFLAINIFKDFKLKIVSIKMNNGGVDLNDLEQKLIEFNTNEKVFFYTIPTFHNPMGITTNNNHRLLLSTLADKYNNFYVIADEVYQLLYFDEDKIPPSPLKYYHNKFISLGSFSKILAPSLRLGWIHASEDILKVLKNSGQLDSSGGLNPLISSIVHKVIDDGLLKENIIKTRGLLRERCDVLYESIKNTMSDIVSVNKPYGGYFLWLKLNNNMDTSTLLEFSDKYKVKFHSGNKFSGHNNLKNCLRISFSYYPKEGMKIGAERLSNMIKDNINNEDNDKLKVSVLGSTGKLGSLIIELLKINNLKYNGSIGRDFVVPDETDIIVDVSTSEATTSLIKSLGNERIPLLIGTTGNLPIKELKLYSRFAPVAVISNFSEGIPMVLEWTKLANEKLNNWRFSIEEKHHIHKKDKPSGTSMSINNTLSNRAKITSIREEEIFGEHRIQMENEVESIEIFHKAKSRNIFAEGAIKYIEWIYNMEPGFYTEMIDNKDEINTNLIEFIKYSGCGNDFIMINLTENNIPDNIHNFAKSICKRGSNIGADGVILMDLDYGDYDAKWIYYNSDGSMAKMCGNGLRCAAKYIYDNSNKDGKLKLITAEGIISTASQNDKGHIYASLPMPIIKNVDEDLRSLIENILDNELMKSREIDNIYRIDVSVPHLVIIIKSEDSLNNLYVNKMGKIINDLISDIDINVNFVCINDGKYIIRTYERGVFSETLACGTGCCSFAFILNKFFGIDKISIGVRSGDNVKIFFKDDSIFLEGNANKVYKGIIDLSELS